MGRLSPSQAMENSKKSDARYDYYVRLVGNNAHGNLIWFSGVVYPNQHTRPKALN